MPNSNIVFDAITVARQAGFAFDVWYANHYLPELLATQRYAGVRRYGSPLRALEAVERTVARSTPWRARLAQEALFRGDYRVYYRHAQPAATPDTP